MYSSSVFFFSHLMLSFLAPNLQQVLFSTDNSCWTEKRIEAQIKASVTGKWFIQKPTSFTAFCSSFSDWHCCHLQAWGVCISVTSVPEIRELGKVWLMCYSVSIYQGAKVWRWHVCHQKAPGFDSTQCPSTGWVMAGWTKSLCGLLPWSPRWWDKQNVILLLHLPSKYLTKTIKSMSQSYSGKNKMGVRMKKKDEQMEAERKRHMEKRSVLLWYGLGQHAHSRYLSTWEQCTSLATDHSAAPTQGRRQRYNI